MVLFLYTESMGEKLSSDAPPNEPSIDPIAFDDTTIFGLDPAVHWVQFNNQRDQFPEIVTEIVKHWDDFLWLEKLLNRLGYNTGLYDAEKNPRGIFERLPAQRSMLLLTPIRRFVMRAAGTKSEKLDRMFRGATYGGRSRDRVWRFSRPTLDHVTARRRALSNKPGPAISPPKNS
jgi:hypothetical protein